MLTLLTSIVDFLGSVLLGMYAIIIGPLGYLRGPLMFERFFHYLKVLAPMGGLTRSVRVAVDWRLGHFDMAIAQACVLIRALEAKFRKKPTSRSMRRVLEDFYTLLARAYMHTGRMDDSMQVILRAQKILGSAQLVGLGNIDAKSAHLIRAGLAAGRLVEGGGLATMFVKSSPQTSKPKSQDKSKQEPKSKTKSAKVIPFPVNECP